VVGPILKKQYTFELNFGNNQKIGMVDTVATWKISKPWQVFEILRSAK